MSTIIKHMNEVSEGMTLFDISEVEGAVNALEIVRKRRGTVYVFGNGGSHATAGHFANDLIKMARIKALCVGDMASAMLAYGNDNGWDRMFCDPLAELLKPEDGVVGISCSGASRNVLAALEMAVEKQVVTIGLTGMSLDSPINHMALNVLIHANYPDIRVQEDVHSILCHAMVRQLQIQE